MRRHGWVVAVVLVVGSAGIFAPLSGQGPDENTKTPAAPPRTTPEPPQDSLPLIKDIAVPAPGPAPAVPAPKEVTASWKRDLDAGPPAAPPTPEQAERRRLLGRWKVTAATGNLLGKQERCTWEFAAGNLSIRDGYSTLDSVYNLESDAHKRTCHFSALGQRWDATYALLDNDTLVLRLGRDEASSSSVIVLTRESEPPLP